MSGRLAYPAPADFVPATIAGGRASPGEIFGAAAEQMRLVDNTNAAAVALEEAYAKRTAAIKAATGEDLGNPMTAGPALDLARTAALLLVPSRAASQRQATDDARTVYQQRLDELAGRSSPEIRDVIGAGRPLEKDAEAAARNSDEELGRLMASNPGWGGTAASLAGSMAASLRDPMTIGSLFVGGGSGTAKTVIGRILQTAAREAFVNGATTAAMQPSAQAWREQAGLPHGFDQAASNVLLAAALGGGLGGLGKGGHELLDVLRRVEPALAPEARGAIAAAERVQALDSLKPEGVPQETFDRQTMRADIAAQGADVPLSPDRPDDVAVNRMVNALAPAPESISGKPEPRSDASIDRMLEEIAGPAKTAMAAPTPILDHLRALGGVDPKSPIADELRHAGVTAKSIYRKGGLQSLDNLPHDELPESVRHSVADDGNGYAREDALVQAAGGEAGGFGAGRDASLRSGQGQPLGDDAAALREHYERQGVDFAAPDVREQIRAVDDAEGRYGAATDEVTHVPEGFTRRAHTEQLVRAALREQPGLPAELVQKAVNLSLFENVPIEEAVSDVMSDAAGVPRVAEEQAAIARAYDQVRAQPVGPAGDPLVRLSPDDIEGAILERGAMKDVSEVDVKSKRGFGLVKIIWKHGEESGLAERLRVGKADVLDLPRVIREFLPSSESALRREWRIERGGRTVVYADTLFPDGERHVVTIHIDEGEGGLSKPRASQPVPRHVVTTREDTAGELSAAAPEAAERPDGSIDFAALGSEPPPLLPEHAIEEPADLDFKAELEAMAELGFGAGDELPIGDGMMSLADLEKQLAETEWLEHVVEACKT